MKKSSNKFWLHFVVATLTFLGVLCIGASSIMILRRACVLEGKRVQSAEYKISVQKRENDFWNAEIANSKTPSKLRSKVGADFTLPHGERMVFAFPLKDISPEDRRLIVFKPRSKTSQTAKTAQR